MNVTKDLVLMYLLDQVTDPATRSEIEHARQTDPQVARWFELIRPQQRRNQMPSDLPPSQPVLATGNWVDRLIEQVVRSGTRRHFTDEFEAITRILLGNSDRRSRVLAVVGLARAYRDTGMFELSEVMFREARTSCAQEGWPEEVRCLNELAWLARKNRRLGEAEELLNAALARTKQVPAPDQLTHSETLQQLAVVRLDQNRFGDAMSLVQQALKIRRQQDTPEGIHIARSLALRAYIRRRRGRYEAALRDYRRALRLRRRALPDNHVDIGETLALIGALLKEQGRHAQAEVYYSRALEIYRRSPLTDIHRLGLGRTHALLAEVLARLERVKGAELRVVSIPEEVLSRPEVQREMEQRSIAAG